MDDTNLIFKNPNAYPFTQYIIVDTGIPTPAHITENIFNAIQNVVCLGQNRIPVLGVALINATFQQVLSLSSTRTQLPKILRSLKTVTDMGKCRARIPMAEFIDSVHIGIRRAMEDFQSFPNKLEENKHSSPALRVTIFTMKNGFDIKSHIEDILCLIPTERLNKIEVVELLEDYMGAGYTKPYPTIPSFVELIKMSGSSLNLDKLMKQWLMEQCTEREHVRILIKDLTILCDFQECLILPYRATDTHENGFKSESEVVNLEVMHRLSSDGLCETQVFGNPVALVATSCSQMDWANRQLNHQHFSSLSEKIMTADEYLVAKYEIKGQPVKYFVLMPGQGLILVKCLVSAEIALPPVEAKQVQVQNEVDERIIDALTWLPTLECYRPADFPSGLYRHLIQSALQPSNTQRQSPLCSDPSHKPFIVGIEVKKTIKGKMLKNRKRKKTSINLPELSDSDQQTITEFLTKKKQF